MSKDMMLNTLTKSAPINFIRTLLFAQLTVHVCAFPFIFPKLERREDDLAPQFARRDIPSVFYDIGSYGDAFVGASFANISSQMPVFNGDCVYSWCEYFGNENSTSNGIDIGDGSGVTLCPLELVNITLTADETYFVIGCLPAADNTGFCAMSSDFFYDNTQLACSRVNYNGDAADYSIAATYQVASFDESDLASSTTLTVFFTTVTTEVVTVTVTAAPGQISTYTEVSESTVDYVFTDFQPAFTSTIEVYTQTTTRTPNPVTVTAANLKRQLDYPTWPLGDTFTFTAMVGADTYALSYSSQTNVETSTSTVSVDGPPGPMETEIQTNYDEIYTTVLDEEPVLSIEYLVAFVTLDAETVTVTPTHSTSFALESRAPSTSSLKGGTLVASTTAILSATKSSSATSSASLTNSPALYAYVLTAVPSAAQTDPHSQCFLHTQFATYTTPSWWLQMPTAAQTFLSSLNAENTADCTSGATSATPIIAAAVFGPGFADKPATGGGGGGKSLSTGAKAGIATGVIIPVAALLALLLYKAGMLPALGSLAPKAAAAGTGAGAASGASGAQMAQPAGNAPWPAALTVNSNPLVYDPGPGARVFVAAGADLAAGGSLVPNATGARGGLSSNAVPGSGSLTSNSGMAGGGKPYGFPVFGGALYRDRRREDSTPPQAWAGAGPQFNVPNGNLQPRYDVSDYDRPEMPSPPPPPFSPALYEIPGDSNYSHETQNAYDINRRYYRST